MRGMLPLCSALRGRAASPEMPQNLIIYLETGDLQAEEAALRVLEEGKWIDLDNRWKARSDKPHTTGMKPHSHIYLKGREMYVINLDGTPSHNSDLSTMPARVRQGLRDKGLIESRLEESASLGAPVPFVPKHLIAEALASVERYNRLARLLSGLGRATRQ